MRKWSRIRFEFDPTKYGKVVKAEMRLYKLGLGSRTKRRGFGSYHTRVHVFNAPHKTRFLSGATLVDTK